MATTSFFAPNRSHSIISSRMATIPNNENEFPMVGAESTATTTTTTGSISSSDDDDGGGGAFIDPYSEKAKEELATFYAHHNLPAEDDVANIHKSLLRLTECVISWNEKINLVSRKECTPHHVYHKHVLPSVALLPLLLQSSSSQEKPEAGAAIEGAIKKKLPSLRVVDIGTGGGFPGLPLALLLPQHEFTLVDSIRKKLVAVSDMASELDITNVRIHCGRAEEMMDGHRGTYDVVLGRSVTALPTFCSWIYELMKKQKQKDRSGGEGRNDHAIGDTSGGGRLIYIIGGDIDDMVQSKVVGDIPIDALLQRSEHISDKRALVFSALGVRQIATEFLGAKRMDEETRKGQRSNVERNNSNNYKSTNNGRVGGRGGGGAGERRAGVGGERRGGAGAGVRRDKQARGAWSEKRNDGVAKQRGYDDFKRYESSP